MSALIIACRLGRTALAKVLLEAAADPSARVKNTTALENAKRSNHSECIKLLTKAAQVYDLVGKRVEATALAERGDDAEAASAVCGVVDSFDFEKSKCARA